MCWKTGVTRWRGMSMPTGVRPTIQQRPTCATGGTAGQGQEAAQVAGFTRLPANFDLFASGGFYISVLALLAGAFQLMQARMMASSTATGQAATMNRVMQFMPIIVVVFAWTFQAGLVVYWVISSIIAIVQQYFTTGTGKTDSRPLASGARRDGGASSEGGGSQGRGEVTETESKPETTTRHDAGGDDGGDVVAKDSGAGNGVIVTGSS